MIQSKDINIIIVDDHMVVRKGLVYVLERVKNIKIVAEAGSGEEAAALCHELKPDIIIMDIKMDGMGGLEATRLITQQYPLIKVLGLSTFASQNIGKQMLDAGAHGHILKNVSAHILIESIFRILSGEILTPSNFDEANDAIIHLHIKDKVGSPMEKMGEKQKKVLILMSKGFTNPEIASHLNISLPTVKYHVSSILQKLDASNRSEAVVLAVRNNLIDENIL